MQRASTVHIQGSLMKHNVTILTALLLSAPMALYSAAPVAGPSHEGLRLWLDASDASTLEVQGSVVARWRDKSGSGNNAVAVGKPMLLPRDFNGHPAISLSGRDIFNVAALAKKVGPITVLIVSVARRLRRAEPTGNGWFPSVQVILRTTSRPISVFPARPNPPRMHPA